jgi:outer membrane lipoprotein-sorting protein
MLPVRTVLAALSLFMLAGTALAQDDPAGTPTPPSRPPVQQTPAGPGDVPPPEFVASGQPLEIDTHPINPQAVSAADKATLDQIDTYFNNIKFFSGGFVQVGSDGKRVTGKFWVSKPGRMRFDYDPPSSLQLLADGTSVAVRNRKLNTQSLYFIKQTPLRFLLAEKLDLIEDSKVLEVGREPAGISVVLEEGSAASGGKSRIQLTFPAPAYDLRQWTITDPQGYDTTVTISGIDRKLQLPDRIFYIDQQKILK